MGQKDGNNINLNILECKSRFKFEPFLQQVNINLNILECKSCYFLVLSSSKL